MYVSKRVAASLRSSSLVKVYTRDGKQDGLWTWWNEHGDITEQTTYKNGEKVK